MDDERPLLRAMARRERNADNDIFLTVTDFGGALLSRFLMRWRGISV